MQLVGPTSGDRRDNRAGRPAVFGAESRCDDLEFLDRIDAQVGSRRPARRGVGRIINICSVEKEAVGIAARAGNTKLVAARAAVKASAGGSVFDDTRDRVSQRLPASAVKRPPP